MRSWILSCWFFRVDLSGSQPRGVEKHLERGALRCALLSFGMSTGVAMSVRCDFRGHRLLVRIRCGAPYQPPQNSTDRWRRITSSRKSPYTPHKEHNHPTHGARTEQRQQQRVCHVQCLPNNRYPPQRKLFTKHGRAPKIIHSCLVPV